MITMPNTIGMSVPGASSLFPPSPADQVAGESEEERKRRLQKLQAARQLPSGSSSLAQGYGAALGGGV
jgi:hypothetical protein